MQVDDKHFALMLGYAALSVGGDMPRNIQKPSSKLP